MLKKSILIPTFLGLISMSVLLAFALAFGSGSNDPDQIRGNSGKEELGAARAGESNTSPSVLKGGEFPDVTEAHWAAGKIKVLVKNKIIYGYADGKFLPDQRLTRAELAAMLIKVTGDTSHGTDKPVLSDVGKDQWYFSSVEAAKKYFIKDQSVAQGSFRPADFVTRQEAVSAILLAKKLNSGPADTLSLKSAFSDYELIAPAYRSLIALAMSEKLAAGYPDKTFRPETPLTRAEAVSLLYGCFFSDVSISGLLEAGAIKFDGVSPDVSSEGFNDLVNLLSSRFGNWEGVKISYSAKYAPVNGNKDDQVLLVLGRVDRFKYFTFSDAIFKPDPEKIKGLAEKITSAASQMYPDKRTIAMVGFYDLLFYDTVAEVYGRDYTSYSPLEGGWRIERFYAGAMSKNGSITETWVDKQKV